ncbi:MAG: DUF1624 domain-containing protein [Acidobacteria bacterium]|nr:DUF1624 domain-containing protein [Acidobacteriota bacterium]
MTRDRTVDALRGAVMVLMTIDHVQEYQAGPGRGFLTDPMNLEATPAVVYFFRILSHFCAPVFALLMGVSASLSAKSAPELLRRGLLLLLLESTAVNWSWTFNPFWPRYFFQVIGALGAALLCLALAVRWPRRAIALAGLTILCLHNTLDAVRFDPGTFSHYAWSFLHQKDVLPLWGGFEVRTTYPVLPVIGIVFCGYAAAPWFTDRASRARLVPIGLAICGLFVVLRFAGLYGDPSPYSAGVFPVRSFFNVTKYPMSLQYVLMTLGPALLILAQPGIACAWLERFGQSPMFFYLAHLILIHAVALAVSALAGYPPDSRNFGFIGNGFGFPPWASSPLAILACGVLWPLCGRAGMRIKL